MQRRVALDGLRGIAILMVVAGHAFGISSLGLGVDVFFVLSGYLITTLLLREWVATGGISLRGFYARRARRILPAALVYALVFAVVVAAVKPTAFGSWSVRAAGAVFYAGNVLRAFNISQPVWPFGQFWSLAEEEQFYLLWPALLIVLLAWRPSSARKIVAAVAAASSALSIVLYETGASIYRIWFGPDTHLAPIAVGCLLALAIARGNEWIARFWPLGTIVAAAIAFSPLGGRFLFDGPFQLFPFAVATVIAAALSSTRATKALEFGPLVWVGGISYSLYLWHLPALLLGPLGLPLAFAAAWASYRWIEQPFLRWRRTPTIAIAAASV